MLSMNLINNLEYYSDLASEDYYISGGEPAGIWAGLGARLLNMKGIVDTDAYRNIFRGFTLDGEELCENSGDSHRAGWDLTFSAPKSVSILWACSDLNTRQQIQDGQLKAVQHAVSFLEQHAAFTRRGHGGHQQEKVTGLIAALFEHSTSRSQDMQLHTHCLVANVAPRKDGSWGTLESRQLFLWQKAAGAVYRSTLANHLREIGFSIEQPEGDPHFEVQGISKKIRDHFSKRAEAIEAALDRLNVSSSASVIGDAIKLTTRSYKQKVDRKELLLQWQEELNELGLSEQQALSLRDHQSIIDPTPLPLSLIIEKVVEKQSVFRLQDLYAAVAIEAQWQHADLQTIESTVQYLIESNEVIALGLDEANNHLFSTPDMIKKEKQLVLLADELQGQVHYRLSEQEINIAIQQQEKNQGFPLSDEQVEGVYSVCQSHLDILQGAAGAGKSKSMEAIKIAYEVAGYNVMGVTVARQAANQLEAETGITSGTLAKLLSELKHGRLQLENTVLVVDEAGQLSSLDLLQLMDAVQCAGGKLILVGEQQQMDAITHGGSLRFLSQRQGCVRIVGIRRQREQWARKAVMQLRAGDSMSALLEHQQRGLVHFSDNSIEAREQLVQEWKKFKEQNPEKKTMVLAQRWRDVKPLNDLMRRYYQEQENVGLEDIEADCIVSNQVMRLKFSVGERVRFTRNDYRRSFTNGELGIIEQVEQRGTDISFKVRCDNGRFVTFNQSDYSDDKGRLYLSQAYASTVYSSQGSTIDGDVFVYYTSLMDRSASYVAGSRHKDSCHWFVNRDEMDALSGISDQGLVSSDKERLKILAKCMSSNRDKYFAIEYMEQPSQEIFNFPEETNRCIPELELL